MVYLSNLGELPVPQVGITEAGGGSGFRPTYLFPLTEVVGQLYAYQENDSIAILGTRKSLDVGNVIGIQEVANGVYECIVFDGGGVANIEQVVVKTAGEYFLQGCTYLAIMSL